MLNPNLSDFWFIDGVPSAENYIKARNRVLYGGRSSGKSHEFAGMAQHIGAHYQTRFLCVRRYQNKIKDSVYTLIKDKIEATGSSGYTVLQNEIRHTNGTEFSFYGIERNTDEIKSFEGADILWIEEAHNLTADQWAILEPTIRKEGSEVWLSFNPQLISDFVYQRFVVNPPPNTRKRLVNYIDNPYLSNTILAVIEAAKDEDYDDYAHVYLGVPKTDDDAAIIKMSWIEAAIDADKVLGIDMFGALTVGYDVADSGEDKNATAKFNGAVCEGLDEWAAETDELVTSALRAARHAGHGTLIYDSIGVGAHTGATLSAHKSKAQHHKFNAAGAVMHPDRLYTHGIKNKEKFENLKAQAWVDVADRFRNTYNAVNKGERFDPSDLICIRSGLPHIDRLKSELASPHLSISKRGLDVVESKADMAKRGIHSPNLADAFIMGACPHLVTHNSSLMKKRLF